MSMKADKDSTFLSYHFGIGMWMRNNWGLWAGSRLAKYLDSLGIHHPDGMSSFILETFWYRLHDMPVPFATALHRHLLKTLIWRYSFAFKDSLCPIDSAEVNPAGFLDRSDSSSLRVIYFGRCPKGHLWACEPKKGLYVPDQAMRTDIAAFEKTQSDWREEYRRSHPVIGKIEKMLRKVCRTEASKLTKADMGSLVDLFALYEGRGWVPDSLIQCGLDRIADAAEKDPVYLHTLFRLGSTPDREFDRPELLSSCAAGVVFTNPGVLVSLWPQLTPAEKDNAVTTLAPWEHIGLINLFQTLARQSTNVGIKSVATDIAKMLQSD
jgi:hypothetical protein